MCLALTSANREPLFDDSQFPLFQQALAQVWLAPEQMHLDAQQRSFYGGDKNRLPFFDALWDDPWRISPYARRITDALLDKHDDLPTVLMSAQGRLNQAVRLGLTGDVLAPYQQRVDELGADSLAVALAELEQHQGNAAAKSEDYKQPGLRATGNYAQLPPVLRDNAALLLFVIPDVLEYRQRALTQPIERLGLDPQAVYDRVLESTLAGEQDDEQVDPIRELDDTLLIEQLLDNVDFTLLNTGATLLTIAVQKVCANLQAGQADVVNYTEIYGVATSLGYLRLGDFRGKQFAADAPQLLHIATRDSGQPGTACTSCYANPISLCIALNGEPPADNGAQWSGRCAAGIFGYGILADLAGNDVYASEDAAQGFGLFGTGILYDAAGADSYSCVLAGQGSGIYGTGLLIDGDGNDTHTCYEAAQGYGFTKGVGLLLDAGAGSDTYVADDTDIRFPSPQSAEHNVSMAQGVGNGLRADFTNGHSWAGGVGILIDGGGDDTYTCGVFGQGCAYWYGVGILADKGGDDSYYGLWYVQGAGAHFGVAILQDDAGDDTYRGPMNQNLGAGHDFTVAWFEDRAGNDSYEGCNLSLGTGNANGMGVFWDAAGDDSYLTRGITLGQSGGVAPASLREYMLTLGVFVDGGGHDTYREYGAEGEQPAPYSFAGDGLQWTRPSSSQPPMPLELGCAVDAP